MRVMIHAGTTLQLRMRLLSQRSRRNVVTPDQDVVLPRGIRRRKLLVGPKMPDAAHSTRTVPEKDQGTRKALGTKRTCEPRRQGDPSMCDTGRTAEQVHARVDTSYTRQRSHFSA
jgi:hypothetical protein